MICLGRRRAEEPLAVQALLDAAHIAGLNILRVMNEHTARTWYKQMQNAKATLSSQIGRLLRGHSSSLWHLPLQ